MSSHKLLQCAVLAAVLGFAASTSQAGNVVNDASVAIEFRYGYWDSQSGLILSDSVIIDPKNWVSLPGSVEGKPVLAIWRRAGSPGDSGWTVPTGIDPVKTGYIGEFMLIEFR
jgi:hypothetical protein